MLLIGEERCPGAFFEYFIVVEQFLFELIHCLMLRTLGCLPSLIPYAKYLPDPFFSKGMKSIQKLTGIAVARVKERLANAESIERVDLLARLMEGKGENGEALGREELTAEALTQLIAGSDTTSNTSCALLFHTLKHPNVVKKLQAELDERLLEAGVPTYELIKDLP